MVADVIASSFDKPAILLSPDMRASMNALKEWLFENVYLLYPTVNPDIPKAQALVKALFRHYCQAGSLPEGFEGPQGAVDYVAGMTDRFAIQDYARLTLPEGWTTL